MPNPDKSGNMFPYVVGICLVIAGALFAFVYMTIPQVKKAQEANVALSDAKQVQFALADLIRSHAWIIILIMIAACVYAAISDRGKNSSDDE